MNKKILILFLLTILALWGCAQVASASQTLNLALFRYIPNYETFEETVRARWQAIHPETELNFVDWDCYSPDVPEDLDVFVFDAINLDLFVGKNCLLPLSEENFRDYDDLIPSMVEGCRVDGTIYVVPQLLCTELLYTRKDDKSLGNVQSIFDLSDALGDDGLLLEGDDEMVLAGLYLQALIDAAQRYMDTWPLPEGETLSQAATDSLERVVTMLEDDLNKTSGNGDGFDNARRFAEGVGSAYIGYSESMGLMGESASDMDFRLFSMTGDSNIPVFYVDAAAINGHIPEEKRAIALELLNMITDRDMLVAASINDGHPRYLLPARYSVYDALAVDYPIYAGLKAIASTPNAHVFRIKPDGVACMTQVEQSVSALSVQ